jgi:nanoRNase/pAp phosphatase (c-di-AMP/oligoRNAs hydrolase)
MITQDQQIFNHLKKAKNILLVFSSDWNGDSIAGVLALSLLFKKMGKTVTIAGDKTVCGVSAASLFDFLPNFSEIKAELDNLCRFVVSVDITNAKIDQIKYVIENNLLNFIISPKEGFFTPDNVRSEMNGFKYDLIVAVGAPDLESLGEIFDKNVEFFYKTPVINIDNHPGNEEFGQINFVELNAVAVCEILYYLVRDYAPELIDEDLATCLLCGIISKTKSFKTPNLTPHALATTSELIKLGARREEIVSHLYRSRDLPVLKLWGKLLDGLKASEDDAVVWAILKREDFDGLSAVEDLLAEAVHELIAGLPQARAALIFYPFGSEKDTPATKILACAVKNVNALDWLQSYRPNGSKRLATAVILQAPAAAAAELVPRLRERLEKLPQ